MMLPETASVSPPSEYPWLACAVTREAGGCNYYRASPLRPPRPEDPAAAAVTLPRDMLTVEVPTLVLWAMEDVALPPELIDGLDEYIGDLTLGKVAGATHWIVHERPDFVAARLAAFLGAKS